MSFQFSLNKKKIDLFFPQFRIDSKEANKQRITTMTTILSRKSADGSIHYKEFSNNEELFDTIMKTQERYDEKARNGLILRTIRALENRYWSLELSPNGAKSGLYGDQQIINLINAATDVDYYIKSGFHKDFEPAEMEEGEGWTQAEGVIINLISHRLDEAPMVFSTKGGHWSCGQHSGVWCDFSIKVKVKDNFKGYAPHGAFYLGIRLTLNNEMAHQLGKERFDVSSVVASYEPYEEGDTTIMFPRYATPFVPKKIIKYESRIAKAAKEEKEAKKEAKKEAIRLAAIAERERRKLYAKVEVALDETILAYNAEQQKLKDLIRFNREKVAEPLVKRMEAKEAERKREEAERRHAEKLAQKELERRSKFAPKR
jgi:hypothetical protein